MASVGDGFSSAPSVTQTTGRSSSLPIRSAASRPFTSAPRSRSIKAASGAVSAAFSIASAADAATAHTSQPKSRRDCSKPPASGPLLRTTSTLALVIAPSFLRVSPRLSMAAPPMRVAGKDKTIVQKCKHAELTTLTANIEKVLSIWKPRPLSLPMPRGAPSLSRSARLRVLKNPLRSANIPHQADIGPGRPRLAPAWGSYGARAGDDPRSPPEIRLLGQAPGRRSWK